MTEGKDLTFLVVDDNDTIRTIMPRFLQNNFPGCGVVTAASFEEAKVALHANPNINYIISDFQIGSEVPPLGESISCGAFLKEAVHYKKQTGADSSPLLGVAVHTSLELLNPSRDLPAYHRLRIKGQEVRDCGTTILELEKYGDWDEKCKKIKAHIVAREAPLHCVSR